MTTPTNKAVALKLDDFQALDTIAKTCTSALAKAEGQFIKAHATATAMMQLQEKLEPMVPTFMPLQNSPLGFKTDNAAGYQPDVVRDCIIEATLRGVEPVGNQFNIISGRCYITKEGYEYKLRNVPGLTELKVDLGVPKMHPSGEGAIVECSATWKLKGVADSKKSEIPVRVNKGMGSDAILGKATRKFLKRIFEQVTGSSEPEALDEEGAAFDNAKPAKAEVVASAPNFGTKKDGELV